MAVDVKVDTSQWRDLIEKVEAVRERAQNLEPVLKSRALALDAVIKKSFELDSGNDPSGKTQWKVLADSTIERRRKGKRPGIRPLVDTGALKTQTGARATDKSVIFGVSGPAAAYAGAHQFGTTRAGRGHKTTIPPRPFLPMDNSGADFGAESSRAGTWLKRTLDRVKTYITTGRLS